LAIVILQDLELAEGDDPQGVEPRGKGLILGPPALCGDRGHHDMTLKIQYLTLSKIFPEDTSMTKQ